MPWGVVAAAVVGAYSTSAQSRASAFDKYAPPEPDLEQLAREHRAKMEAVTAKTLRDAKIGAGLLLALIVVVGYGCAQLLGLV